MGHQGSQMNDFIVCKWMRCVCVGTTLQQNGWRAVFVAEPRWAAILDSDNKAWAAMPEQNGSLCWNTGKLVRLSAPWAALIYNK